MPATTTRLNATSVDRAHIVAVSTKIADIARFLQDNLGQRLTARIAGISDPKQVGRWATGAATPRPAAEARLRDAIQIFNVIQQAESVYIARAWMIGMNPQLEDMAPAQCIADGRSRDVMVAARAYINNICS
ncbi:XRE family transcriptional regulator [Streptomyces cellostaticus]|uniref:XRE family transcriptional regulator n=1 Tax=Streptomyces cellostaticus TaxID=67285 RepID=UPI0020272348|nr:XRE family transcriptional regulator [Streptomyces cellostaticus]